MQDRFDIKAINQTIIILSFVGSMIFFACSMAFLVITKNKGIIPFAIVLIAIALFWLWARRYFVYPASLELHSNEFKIITQSGERRISFRDLNSYKIERMNGVRLVLSLKNGKKVRLIATHTLDSTPEPLEEFCKAFEEKIKTAREDEMGEVKREKGFLETTFGFYFTLIVVVFALGSAVVLILIGKGSIANISVIVAPSLALIPALIDIKRRNN